MQIEETPWGIWLKFPDGRSRYAIKGSELYARVKAGLAPVVRERGNDVTTYYVDQDGTIGVPPTADTLIPEGAVKYEAKTLSEQDDLGRRIAEQHRRRWEGSAEMTEQLEQGLNSPRKILIEKMTQGRYRSQLEKDLVPMLIADLDKEEADRNRITSTAYIHAREMDRRR